MPDSVERWPTRTGVNRRRGGARGWRRRPGRNMSWPVTSGSRSRPLRRRCWPRRYCATRSARRSTRHPNPHRRSSWSTWTTCRRGQHRRRWRQVLREPGRWTRPAAAVYSREERLKRGGSWLASAFFTVFREIASRRAMARIAIPSAGATAGSPPSPPLSAPLDHQGRVNIHPEPEEADQSSGGTDS